jgi:hypothetical protein
MARVEDSNVRVRFSTPRTNVVGDPDIARQCGHFAYTLIFKEQ